MDQVHVIRHKVLVEKLSQRQVARELGVSRNTVRRYLTQAEPKYGPRREVASRVRDAVRPRLQALLAESAKWTGGKQRLTATRLHAMLVAEGHRVGLTTVKEMVAEHKRQQREVFVPLVYKPGDLAEVDFFEVLVDIEGQRRKAWMFLMRLMHSGRDFAWLYERQDQASFLDGHVRAFAHLGGVPHRLAYDNLRAAVARILVGSERKLTQRFEALASHYLFEACFCRPRTGHDKGGVEARGKGIRWQHLVPIPQGRSLDEISAALLAKLDAQQEHGRDAERRTTAERFELERAHLLAVPPGRFESGTTVLAGVTRRALVRIEGAYYSVWCRWAGLDVTAIVRAFEVVLVGPGAEQVVHPRLRFGQRAIDYRHYLVELRRKPQALRQVADELVRDLGTPFDAAWRSLCEAHGSRQAARIFAKLLEHLVRRGTDAVAHVVAQALSTGTPLLLALADSPRSTDPLRAELVPDSLRGIDIEAGQAGDYDALLDAGALRAGGVR